MEIKTTLQKARLELNKRDCLVKLMNGKKAKTRKGLIDNGESVINAKDGSKIDLNNIASIEIKDRFGVASWFAIEREFKTLFACFVISFKVNGKTIKYNLTIERALSGAFHYGDRSCHIVKLDGKDYRLRTFLQPWPSLWPFKGL